MALLENNSNISAFRGLAYKPSRSTKRGTNGSPMSSKTLGEKFALRLKLKNSDEKSAVFDNWEACIPAAFRGKCAPVNVRLNVLYASACNSAVRQELAFAERTILKKINALDGCSKIKKIRFI